VEQIVLELDDFDDEVLLMDVVWGKVDHEVDILDDQRPHEVLLIDDDEVLIILE
jgi:hypothetical protein